MNYIGIDAGGTKTDGVLINSEGAILARETRAGVNPNDVGVDAAISALAELIRDLADRADAPVAAFAGVSGVMGYGEDFETRLRRESRVDRLSVGTDAIPILSGVLGREDGACVISGTGSVTFVRRGGELTRIGGWGYLLDPSGSGSGFDLGRDALAAVLHAADGQGEPTMLTEIVTRQLGGHPKDRIPEIYAGGRSFIASFAGAVFEGYDAGDEVARTIIGNNCMGIAQMLDAASVLFGGGEFTVALGGGIFTHYPVYSQMLSQFFAPEGARLRVMDMPAVYGSAVEAVLREGGDVSEKFRCRFSETLG